MPHSKYPLVSVVLEQVKTELGYMHEQLTKAELAAVVKLVMSYYDKGYEAGYWAYRDELAVLLDTKDRNDSFFVKSEIKRQMKGLK